MLIEAFLGADSATDVAYKNMMSRQINNPMFQASPVGQRIMSGLSVVLPSGQETFYTGPIDKPAVDPSVPGGGAAGQAGQTVEAGVVAPKTALQKYGPVAALVAGGIAAYMALR